MQGTLYDKKIKIIILIANIFLFASCIGEARIVTTAQGLGENHVHGVCVVETTVYVATDWGLSISTDSGINFVNKTTATTPVLGSTWVHGVYVVGNTIYAATEGGLSISTNIGNTFHNIGTIGFCSRVYADGNKIYVSTRSGLYILDVTDGLLPRAFQLD